MKPTFKSKKGVTIIPMGLTESTRSYEDSICGFKSMVNPEIRFKNNSVTRLPFYDRLLQEYVKMGFRVGFSLQIIPYDWRFDVRTSPLQGQLKGVVEDLFTMWTKKVQIVGHGIGNLHVLEYLYSLQ